MERELWKRVYQIVIDIANGSSIKRAVFDDARIVLVYLWAVLHDRPVSWACQKGNWRIYDWRKQLPTSSKISRRMGTTGLQSLLRAVEHSFRKMYSAPEGAKGFCFKIFAKVRNQRQPCQSLKSTQSAAHLSLNSVQNNVNLSPVLYKKKSSFRALREFSDYGFVW